MKNGLVLGATVVAGAIAYRFIPRDWRARLTSAVKHRMGEHMEQMMAGLPEGSPPKLVMSVLPRLKAQNDQIIALLQEQNELLREQQHSSTSKAAA